MIRQVLSLVFYRFLEMKKKENTVVTTKSNVIDTNYFTTFLQTVIVGNFSLAFIQGHY